MSATNATPAEAPAKMGTAVVTGASSGLGKVYADRLARRGYNLLLVARSADKLEQLASLLRSNHGVAASILVADLSVATDLDKVASVISGDTDITMLVNNAGTATLAPMAAATVAQIEAMDSVNIMALVRLSQAALPRFLERRRGTLINIGSVLGVFTLPTSAIYSATKGYVQNLTRAMQQEVAGSAVVVQLVMPSVTATDIWDHAGVALSGMEKSTVMSADDCVDAALAGLDQGELVTLPSLEDTSLLAAYEAAGKALFFGARSGQPATRYGIGN